MSYQDLASSCVGLDASACTRIILVHDNWGLCSHRSGSRSVDDVTQSGKSVEQFRLAWSWVQLGLGRQLLCPCFIDPKSQLLLKLALR